MSKCGRGSSGATAGELRRGAVRVSAVGDQSLLEKAWRLHRAGEHGQAAELYKTALRADPGNVDALFRLGFLYGQLRQFEEAQRFIGEAIKRNPNSPEWFLMRGSALQQLGRHDEALSCFGAALSLNPGFAEALLNRASSLFRLRRYQEAATDYQRLLALDPEYPFAGGNLLFSRLHCCDWRGYEESQAAIAVGIARGARVIAPFDAKALDLSTDEELRCARIWAADQYQPASPLWRGEAYAHEHIRLAYVSADFHAHAMATLMAGVFEHHDRKRFEITAISFGPNDGSAMRGRLARAFDRFIDVRSKSDQEIARLMHEMKIDIAVDLMGYTEGCRPAIFVDRPAPVQVNYLGFPGTVGADFMDYLIADETVIPAECRSFYAEKVVTLPKGFMPADCTRAVGTKVFTRIELGLPQDGFVFCCFNASYKISPWMFAIWMRVLTAVPGSVLWIGQANKAAMTNLTREAQARGIAADRLVFASYVELSADHLARLKCADLFLDTLPYNAHATAADALWAGLPVLTCAGEKFAGRVAASLLHAGGLPELATASLAEYERAALALARDPDLMAGIKAKLQCNRAAAPLFDTAGFTRNLERAFAEMVARQRRGLPPASFAVAP